MNPGALHCAICGRIICRNYTDDPRGSKGICPECLLDKYVEWGLLSMAIQRLLIDIDKTNKADYHAALSAIRETMEKQ